MSKPVKFYFYAFETEANKDGSVVKGGWVWQAYEDKSPLDIFNEISKNLEAEHQCKVIITAFNKV